MPKRFEAEPPPNDPEWIISELRTLSARWGEADVKRPLSREAPVDLPAPDEQELRQRERAIVQQVQQAIEAGTLTGEQKERLIIAFKEAEQYFDDDQVVSQLADLRDLLEFGPRELP